jgi:DNA polymerase III epsilon subunit
MRYVVVDTETTGLQAGVDRVVEIALVEIVDGVIGERFQSYLKPGVDISEDARRVNRIPQHVVDSAPTYAEVFPTLRDFVRNDVVVAHFAEFDISMLSHEDNIIGESLWQNLSTICTRKLSKTVWPGESGSLRNVCARLELPYEDWNAHSALHDAVLTALAFRQLAPRCSIVL